ncbi:MAG: hypothetical protein GQ577_09680 [Woeseiaceae bacterium]|jgi:hypothetical protein|nr:hypothetical protein [Woeseiaceae bacterium]
MIARIMAMDEAKLHKLQQAVKWTVYTLLLINFVYYIFEDWDRASHILHGGSTFLDWTSEFANSIDESAWFLLLLMFELETYVFEDKDWKGWLAHTVRGIRLACMVMIAHTIFAYADTVMDYLPTVSVENVSTLCDLTDEDISYVYNLDYTEVTSETCAGLSTATEFYWVADDPVVTDLAGLKLERDLAWVDLAEAVIWLLILLAIEVIVRMQSHGITGGKLMSTLNRVKFLLYAILISIGVYWAWLSHWLYLWDELVWIGGFAAIEMNVSEWRDELIEEGESA